MAAVELRVGGNLAMIGAWAEKIRRQIPFAASRALNDTARQAVKDYRATLPSLFDRPTPFTLNSAFTRPATKDNLSASVELRHFAGKGTPADRYLGPEILGGARGPKRFEKALGATVGEGLFAVPARGAQLDQYGNMSRGQIVKILSRVGALGDQNAGVRTRGRLGRAGLRVRHGRKIYPGDYFVAKSKDGKPLGVWRLVSRGKVQPVLLFSRSAPSYRKRLDFFGIVQHSAAQNFNRFLAERLKQAVATAR